MTGTVHLWGCGDRCRGDRRVGFTMFHGHTGALVTARRANKRAGTKVKKVKVEDHHFHVVDV